MTEQLTISNRKLPVLKFITLLLVVTSILFPSIFSFISGNQRFVSLLSDIVITFLLELTTAIFIYGIVQFLNRLLLPEINRWWRYPLELMIVLSFGYFILYLLHIGVRADLTKGNAEVAKIDYRLYISINQVGTFFIYLLITSFNLYQLMFDKSKQAEKLQKEFAHVRLQALKSQVNPHFLFNSLSVLSSLVHVSAETSEKFIIQLSKAYRYILEQKDIQLVSLADELDFLDAYFFLLQIRFDKKIILEKQISTDVNKWQLPPLVLQLLVENAVKHNRMSETKPLVIKIITKDGSIVVSNNCHPREDQAASTGIGLENVRKRIEYISNQNVLVQRDDKLFTVQVPLIKKDKH